MGKHSDGCPDSGHSYGSGCDNDISGEGGSSCNLNNCPGCEKCRGLSCFPYSTLVETPRGKVQIGSLYVGQTVWSFHCGGLTARRITKKLVHKPAKIMRVDFNGVGIAPFHCTLAHSFLTDSGYLPLSKLTVGDNLVHMGPIGESKFLIAGISATDRVEPVFNLYTEGDHNFIIEGGYIAHNFTHLRVLRTLLHRMFFDRINSTGNDRLVVSR